MLEFPLSLNEISVIGFNGSLYPTLFGMLIFFFLQKKKPLEILFSLLGETSHKVLSSSFRRSTTYKDKYFLRLDLSLICSIEFLYNTLSVLFLSISTYSRNLVLLFLSISVYSRNIVTSLKQTISGEKKKLATSKVGSPEKKTQKK